MEEIIPRCLICRCELGNAKTACPKCETLYHKDCYEYNGKCAVYGCVKSPLPLRRRIPSATIPPIIIKDNTWGETLLGIAMMIVIIVPVIFTIIDFSLVPVESDEIIIRDYSVGDSRILHHGESYFKDIFKTTRYRTSSVAYFDVWVKFNGHISAKVSGTIDYQLTENKNQIMWLHRTYGSQAEAVVQQFIPDMLQDLHDVCLHMTDEESLKIEDGARFVINKRLSEVRDKSCYGIRTYAIKVNFIEYAPEYQKKISEQEEIYSEHAIDVARKRVERMEERANRRRGMRNFGNVIRKLLSCL